LGKILSSANKPYSEYRKVANGIFIRIVNPFTPIFGNESSDLQWVFSMSQIALVGYLDEIS
jgi:hypothetical protein